MTTRDERTEALLTRLEGFGRQEFLDERWRYRPGEHVTVIGPTGCGKTWLTYELLQRTATPARPAVVLVKKPRDPLITRRGKELEYRTVRTWPPGPLSWWEKKPAGYLVWPPTKYDPTVDRPAKAEVFRRALMDSYRRGQRIVYVDDAYGVSELLKLREELTEMWTEARSTEVGLWTAFQKPSHVPTWAYNQAEHLFLFHDPDKRSRERFGEIGGIDPYMIQEAVRRLDRHQALYIRRDGPAACIVNP